MIVRLRELRSNEAICRYDNIKKKEDDPMSSLKDKTVTMAHGCLLYTSKRAEEMIAKGGLTDQEYKMASAKLQRALVRLSVKE